MRRYDTPRLDALPNVFSSNQTVNGRFSHRMAQFKFALAKVARPCNLAGPRHASRYRHFSDLIAP